MKKHTVNNKYNIISKIIDVKIEKGIAFPTPKSKKVFPFEKMEVGDSFFYKDISGSSVCYYARRWAKEKKLNKSFRWRKEKDGFRIWRVI